MELTVKTKATITCEDLTKQINKLPIFKRISLINALLGGITPEDIKILDLSEKCTFRKYLKTIAKKFEK